MTSIDKLLSSLKELGVEPSLRTFQERKRNQKLAYLIQQVGKIELGYDFSWYIRGPYSSQLTHDLFAQNESNRNAMPLSEDERNEMLKLKEFLGGLIESPDDLELLVSLHYLRRLGKQYGKEPDEVISTLLKKKPFFSERQVMTAWRKLNELNEY